MICDKERPTEEMIRKAWEDNKDGGGIAWRAEENGKKEVHWKKGLDLPTLRTLINETPFPYIAHFRTSSVGGVRGSLTHPFPIEESGANFISGKTTGLVLFHNGHWHKWREIMFEAVIKFGKAIPKGKWSDTRAIAWLTSIYGMGFLDLIDEKTVAFGPNTMEVCTGTGWVEVHGVMCSQNTFMSRYIHNTSSTTCSQSGCFRTHNLDSEGLCYEHSKIKLCVWHDCKKISVGNSNYCEEHKLKFGGARQTSAFPPLVGATVQVTSSEIGPRRLAAGDMTPLPAEPGGAQLIGPFAGLAAAEELYKVMGADGERMVSKRFLNKVRHWYENNVDQKKLSKEQKVLFGKASSAILIRA